MQLHEIRMQIQSTNHLCLRFHSDNPLHIHSKLTFRKSLPTPIGVRQAFYTRGISKKNHRQRCRETSKLTKGRVDFTELLDICPSPPLCAKHKIRLLHPSSSQNFPWSLSGAELIYNFLCLDNLRLQPMLLIPHFSFRLYDVKHDLNF
jgi:hypothetical protein